MKERIRKETRDGEELVEFMLEAMRNPKTPIKYRMEAARWLAERGFGRAEATEGVPLLITVQGLQVPGVQAPALPQGPVIETTGRVVEDGAVSEEAGYR